MSRRLWRDESVVTVAERPQTFEFRTVGYVDYGNGKGMKATFLHRYDLAAEAGGGTLISYTMRLEDLVNGMWRLSRGIFRPIIWKIGIPSATKPGLKNLARLAEAKILKTQPV